MTQRMRLDRVLRVALVILPVAGLLTPACKTTQNETSLKDAVVSSETAQTAFRVVESTRKYLPFEYSADGCFARATYMQMELAAEGVPSRVIYVRAAYSPAFDTWTGGTPRLGADNWSYHVAPVIKVVTGSSTMEVVLDPGLEPNRRGGAMILEDWLASMKALKFQEAPIGAMSREVQAPEDTFVVSRAADTSTGPLRHTNVRGAVIHTVGEMPQFLVEKILQYFYDMDSYLITAAQKNRITGDELKSRRELLTRRTLALVPALKGQGRLTSENGTSLDLLSESNLRDIQTRHGDRSGQP